MPRPVSAQKRVLDYVIRVTLIARQGEREPIDVVDPRNRLMLKGNAAFPK